MRKWLLFGGLVLTVIGIAVVSLPFGRPFPDGVRKTAATGAIVVDTTHCAAPVVSSWRREQSQAGWFGYAPLTSTPMHGTQPCKPKARRRLAGGGLFLACGVAVVVVARRRNGEASAVDDAV